MGTGRRGVSRLMLVTLAVTSGCTVVDSLDGYAGTVANGARGGTSSFDASHDASGGGGGVPECVDAGQCDDGNPCTDDTCSGNVCHHTPKPGASCSDGNACNGEEVCDSSGKCVKGTPPVVDDGNPCTDDSCDPKLGVTHTLQTNPAPVIVQCGTVTCPAGYYVSKLTCLSQCGACNTQVCVNGVECTRVCAQKTLAACCGNSCDGTECPAGYSQKATSLTGACGCGPGNTGTCQR